MNFKKFVKSLASDGAIYERDADERWLSSSSVAMRITLGTRSVTAVDAQAMPPAIDKMMDQIGHTARAQLSRAVMPFPDGKIKDCVRIFTSEAGDISIAIANDDWSLIEKADLCEIQYTYDLEHDTYEAKALLVKNYPCVPDDEEELVGVILPTATY